MKPSVGSIDGKETLVRIETAIRYEELAYQRCTGSGISTAERVSLLQFEEALYRLTPLKIVIKGESAPGGSTREWDGKLLVEGKEKTVSAWRTAEAVAAPGSAKALAEIFTNAAPVRFLSSAEALPVEAEIVPTPNYSVRDHRLAGVDGKLIRQFDTPHKGGALKPKYLIMHYTAGTTLEGAVSWFLRNESKASAHVVIARDGSAVQMLPFNRIAWHAGVSAWGPHSSLNSWSIGIELVNAGRLHQSGGAWRSWAESPIREEEVVQARHRLDDAETGWHRYTEAQIAAAIALSTALHAQYGFEEVLGHDDVAPKRKQDPGPAFPMEAFRGRVLGRG